MNKNSNTLFGSKQNNTVVKNIVEAEPEMYGAAPSGSNTAVRFAYHDGQTNVVGTQLSKDANDAGRLVFNALAGTGAIYLGTELVSSKILDVTYTRAKRTVGEEGAQEIIDASAGVNTVSVKYVKEDGTIDVSTFEVVDEAAVQGWLDNINSNNDEKFAEIDASIADIKGYLDNDNIASATKDVIVTPSVLAEGNYKKTYDLKVNIDGSTIMRDGTTGVLSAKKRIEIVEGVDTEAGHKYLALKAENGEVENKIDLCDIVGTGLVKSASYNNTTNKLTLTLATADGTQKEPIVIDLADLFDINDITIKEDSSNYLNFTIDVSTGKIGANMVSLLGEDGKPLSGTVANGLLDASVAKSYIDQKTTDLAVTAEGDDYVSATVNAVADNKHVIVDANVADVTVDAGALGSWTVSESGVATRDGYTAPSISGDEKTLLDGKQAIESIKTYVDAKVSAESAERSARIEAAVKALDKVETTPISNEHLTIKYSETDGLITINASTADIASAALLGTTVDGSTAQTAFGYIAKEAALRTQAIEALDVTSNTVDGTNTHVTYKEENGIVTIESISEDYSSVTRVEHVDAAEGVEAKTADFTVVNGTKLVVGNDLAKLKGYTDDKIKESVSGSLNATVKDEVDDFIKITIVQEKGLLKSTDLDIKYGAMGTYGVNGENGLATTNLVQTYIDNALTWSVI